jgi:hypothetical protein
MFESGDQQTLLRGDVAGMGEKRKEGGRKEGKGRVLRSENSYLMVVAQGFSTCTGGRC